MLALVANEEKSTEGRSGGQPAGDPRGLQTERGVRIVDGEVGEAAAHREAQDVERLRRQRMRSIAIAVALGLLVLLFYAATIVRLGGNVLNRPM